MSTVVTTTSLDEAIGIVLAENTRVLRQVCPAQVAAFTQMTGTARSLFFTGQGRSGMALRMAAMRLAHLGRAVHVVGETATPPIMADDWLVAASGSGRTAGVLLLAQTAKDAGARLAVITADADSPLAATADLVITIPAAAKDDRSGRQSEQFAGSLFEQGTVLLLDAVFLILSADRSAASLWSGHANLE